MINAAITRKYEVVVGLIRCKCGASFANATGMRFTENDGYLTVEGDMPGAKVNGHSVLPRETVHEHDIVGRVVGAMEGIE